MKKVTFLILGLVIFAHNGFSQENQTETDTIESGKTEYNKWSIEGNVGINKPDDNFSPNYFSSEEENVLPFNNINHYNLGVRYMFNEKFGLKLDGAYDMIRPESDNNGSPDFETKQYRLGLQGVVNLRNILDFDSFTKRFGLLGHAGIQVNWLSPDSRDGVDISSNPTDQNGGFIFGLTPQFKFTERIVLTADASFLSNSRSHLYWDGVRNNSEKNLNSSLVNVSLGLTVYLGKHDTHADWVVVEDDLATKDDLEKLKNKLDEIEDKMKDDDNDGVPNYLDIEPNTPVGAYVNSKGESIDANGNGIPDAMEEPLDDRYAQNMDVVKELADKGVLAVYFDFDVSVPQAQSYSSIKAIIEYMKENSSSNVTVTGYADELGSETYNGKLSTKRAEKVRDIMVSSGIDASRIETVGGGEDKSADKNSEISRQLVRRAYFKLN